jgi:hypothetical protein
MDSPRAPVTDGFRRGPVTVRLAGEPPRHVNLTLRALPENGGRVSVSATPALVPAAGGRGRPAQRARVSRTSPEACSKPPASPAWSWSWRWSTSPAWIRCASSCRSREVRALDVKLAGAVRAESHAGGMATRLSPDRFALVRAKADHPDDMAERLTRATTIEASAHVVPIDGGVAPARGLKALRYALDDFLREGLKDTPPTQPVGGDEPVGQAHPVAGRRPGRGGQPAALHPGLPARGRPGPASAHHHEALVRFEDGGSPFAADPHGRGVRPDRGTRPRHRRDGGQAHRPGPLGRAEAGVNVSGRTIVNEGFVDHVIRTPEGPARAPRTG